MHRLVPLAIPLTLLLWPLQAHADSMTVESIFSLQAARQLAIGQIPAGAVMTKVSCVDINVRGDDRYRCTVYYNPAPKGTEP